MKIKLAILEKDMAYLTRLVSVFNMKYADQLEIYSFTDEEVAYTALMQTRIEVFLASTAFEIMKARVPAKSAFAYLVDTPGIDTMRGEKAINKFQKAELIYKQILSLYSESAEGVASFASAGDGTGRIIAFLSASGGTGSSTAAAACAIHLASAGKNVLYLNFEQFGSADVFFSGEGNGNFGDIIYAIKSKKGNIALKIESTVKRDVTGVCFFSATQMALDMAELRSTERAEFLKTLRGCTNYDYIILDTDFSLAKSKHEVLRECDRIVFVSDGSLTSNVKLRRVIESLKILENQQDWNLLKRCGLMYNRFSSKTSSKLEGDELPEIGGIKRYEGYETKALLRELSGLEVFRAIV